MRWFAALVVASFVAVPSEAQSPAATDEAGDTAVPHDTKLDLRAVSWENIATPGNVTFRLSFEVLDIPGSGSAPPPGYDAYGWLAEFALGSTVHRVQVSYEPAPYGPRVEVYVCTGPANGNPAVRPLVMASCRGINQWPDIPAMANSRVEVVLDREDLGLANGEGGFVRNFNASTYVVERGVSSSGGWRTALLIDSTASAADFQIPGYPREPTSIIAGPSLQDTTKIYQLVRSQAGSGSPWRLPGEPTWWWLLGAPILGGAGWVGRTVYRQVRRKRGDPRKDFDWRATDYKARADLIYRPARKQLRLWVDKGSLLLPRGIPAANPEEKVDYEFWNHVKDEHRLLLPSVPENVRELLDKAQALLSVVPHEVASVNRRAQRILDQKANAFMDPRPNRPYPARVYVNPSGIGGVNPYELWVRRESLGAWIQRTVGPTQRGTPIAELIVDSSEASGIVVGNHGRAETVLQEVVQELSAEGDAGQLMADYQQLKSIAVTLDILVNAELADVPIRPD